MDVTEAEDMTPESRRLREQRRPASVQSLRSTLRRSLRSRSSCSSCSSSVGLSERCPLVLVTNAVLSSMVDLLAMRGDCWHWAGFGEAATLTA